MGNRLSKIVTKTGDSGTTGLASGERVSKASARIHALGEIDELNSCIGLLLTQSMDAPVRDYLIALQHDLFELGAELSIPGAEKVNQVMLNSLEQTTEELNQQLLPLREFILPGGSQAAAFCHLARSVCRRTERALVQLNEVDAQNPRALAYINRLSDYLFVLARHLNKFNQQDDTLWSGPKRSE
ncbi:MAG: cob(I)yrinic acid a,c-diamide adenosyltransferase [Gammaproteobacteria bacterium]|nr:cob(I)yrinic acid a,c-diamide adenosyltransferase [Gammaproteobacteria bacterium]MDH5731819.1 cob(I)yrinic acid a,c-diamide adenosyltransferase [Gammaproteobacteria bacterium]